MLDVPNRSPLGSRPTAVRPRQEPRTASHAGRQARRRARQSASASGADDAGRRSGRHGHGHRLCPDVELGVHLRQGRPGGCPATAAADGAVPDIGACGHRPGLRARSAFAGTADPLGADRAARHLPEQPLPRPVLCRDDHGAGGAGVDHRQHHAADRRRCRGAVLRRADAVDRRRWPGARLRRCRLHHAEPVGRRP